MSVNSLTNFGVPGQGGERSAVLQPILSNRYRVVFYNFGDPGVAAPYELTRGVRTVTRPTYRFDSVDLRSYVSTVYIATRVEFEEGRLVLFDDIDNTTQSRVQQQISKQQNMFDQTASRAGQNYKFEMDIDVLAGGASAGQTAADPNVIQKWCLVGCFLTNAEMGELTYNDANPMEIQLSYRFDNAICFDQDGNRLGTFDHQPEIDAKAGNSSTGIGGTS